VYGHLGKGGFANVYRVQSLDSSRIYACKIIEKKKLTSSEHRRKLVSEIKLHQSLQHKNIVKFERHFECRKNVYILLEVCHNGSLMELSLKRHKLTEHECRYFMKDILIGIKYLHSRYIIHRDLKLGNILLDKNLKIKICDFGLAAKLNFDSERKTTICGTPNYTAPEIILGKKTGEGHSYEVDIWSIGVIMFTLLTGKPPFETKNIKETYRRIRKIKYQFPINSDKYISNQAKNLISKIFMKDPNHRPNLSQISNHSFFKQLPTPKLLPLCILKRTPTHQELFPLSQSRSNSHSPDAMSMSHSLSQSRSASLNIRASSPMNTNMNNDSDPNSRSQSQSRSRSNSRPPITSKGFTNYNGYNNHNNNYNHNKYQSQRNILQNNNNNNNKYINDEGPESENENEDDDICHDKRYNNLHKKNPLQSQSLNKMRNDTNTINRMQQKDNKIMNNLQHNKEKRGVQHQSNENINKSYDDFISIIKYVDYTKKYGLGYILSNGCTGIYFNDSTKILLFENKQNIFYIDQNGLKTFCSLINYPSVLKKKVTLLKHFTDYLWKPINGENLSENDQNINKQLIDLKMRYNDNNNDNDELLNDDETKIFLKNHISDQYCNLWKLSNNMVQVNFTDNSQIMIYGSLCLYRDKNLNKNIYHLNEIDKSNKKDLKKRCKYTEQLLMKIAKKGSNNSSQNSSNNSG